MSEGQLGVLHTNSSYAPAAPSLPQVSEDIKMQRIMSQIGLLEEKERAFASRFGYSSIEDMIADVRRILREAPNDMRALQQFSSSNLRKHLEQFKSKYGSALQGQKVQLTFVSDNKDMGQLNKILNSSGGNGTVSYTMSGEVQFNVEWNTGAIKSIINKMKGTHFQTEKDNIDYLRSYILNSPDTFINITSGGASKSIEHFLIENTSNPFALSKKEINELNKTNRPLLVELEQKIKSFIYNDLCANASADFKRAVQVVMGQKIQQLTDVSFFMGGKNWSGTVGAFGELQTAIMFQYIANKVPNKIMATQISKIIGDTTNSYNQQLHTDLEILQSFGIQVKNYSGTFNNRLKQERTVSVNLHPTEVAALGANEGVVDYIVNSYFNTSISKYPEDNLNEFFKAHASELLNLDLSPNIPDQVCFYMIGSNFIPGSVLLRQAFLETALEVNTSISGAEGGDDSYYNEPRQEWHLPFHKWWRSTSYNLQTADFTPTGVNRIEAWDGKVSITTTFTYSALFEGAYSLF